MGFEPNLLNRCKVGFSGTREGMSTPQFKAFRDLIFEWSGDIAEFHHGACVGADADAAAIVSVAPWDVFKAKIKMIARPGNMPRMVSQVAINLSDLVLPSKGTLARNKDIVNACTVLVACPKTTNPNERSGTWSTIRYAIKTGVQVVVISPTGATCIITNKQPEAEDDAK